MKHPQSDWAAHRHHQRTRTKILNGEAFLAPDGPERGRPGSGDFIQAMGDEIAVGIERDFDRWIGQTKELVTLFRRVQSHSGRKWVSQDRHFAGWNDELHVPDDIAADAFAIMRAVKSPARSARCQIFQVKFLRDARQLCPDHQISADLHIGRTLRVNVKNSGTGETVARQA